MRLGERGNPGQVKTIYLVIFSPICYFITIRAVNSAVECHPHTVEVAGSNPVPPTINHFPERNHA